jgi:hypothetical protein
MAVHPDELADCNHSPERLFELLNVKLGAES